MGILKKIFSSKKIEKSKTGKLDFFEIPDKERIEFHRALYNAEKDKFIGLIEKYNVEINSLTQNEYLDNFLIEAINCNTKFYSSDNQIGIIKYLIDKGININHKNKNGINALHISLAYHNLSKASLILINNKNIDIHSVDDKGNNPIFIAIREYGLTWRKEQKEVNRLRFEIIKELLNQNAELDKTNNYGISSRKWLEISEDEKLHELINKYENKIDL